LAIEYPVAGRDGHRHDLDSPDVDDVVGIVRRMLYDIDKRQELNRKIT